MSRVLPTQSDTLLSRPVAVAVATHNRHLVSHIAQKLKCVGMSVVGVVPTAEAIHGLISESQSGIVIIDALQNCSDALALAKVLAESRPQAKVVILGGKADLALVAKSLLAKASHFLLDGTPSDEFGKAIADLAAGKLPSEDCLCGRVLAEIPVPTGKEESFRTPSGRRLSAEEAIKQCDQFGIAVDDIATYLRVAITEVERVTKKARTSPKPSVLSGTLSPLLPEMSSPSSGLPTLRRTMLVLAMVVAAGAAISFGRRRPSLDRFIPLKGTAVHEDGQPLSKDTALMFGLQPTDGSVPPTYCGTARITGTGGEFAAVLRVATANQSPLTFRVAVVVNAAMPTESGSVAAACGDLSTTPVLITTTGSNIRIRCPRDYGK